MFESLIESFPMLEKVILDNTILGWIWGVVIFFVAVVLLKLFQIIVVKRLKKLSEKTQTDFDDIVINAIDSIYWPFYAFASLYIALQFIQTPDAIQRWTFNIFMVLVIYYSIKFASKIIDFGAGFIIAKKEDDQDTAILKLLSKVAKIVLWGGAIVLVLSNLGYNVSSLIAGLGIGGIAIALALQNILGDLFSSLSIYFDKPFKIGDYIVVGDQKGEVTKIGIKTTRIKVPQGEELVVANSELTKTQVRNFGVIEKWRAVHSLGVTYETKHEKLQAIPGILKGIVDSVERATFNRAHFKSFGDFALIYELVYYIEDSEYSVFMDKQQEINLLIAKKFQEEGIEFAYPTQTVFVKK